MTPAALHDLAERLGKYKRHAEIHPAMEKITVGEFLDVVLWAQKLDQRLRAASDVVEYARGAIFHADTKLEDLLMVYDDSYSDWDDHGN